MKDLLNHTQQYSFNWGKSLNEYSAQKKTLEWGSNPRQTYYTDLKIKENDKVFNPILQVYNEKSKEDLLKQKEKTDLHDAIARNQDNQLKKEQTFNVINLRDRLKGFENDPNYPANKGLVTKPRNIEYNKKNYNILSNKPLSEHHYDRPENRPKTEISQPSKSSRLTSYLSYRDYNIISNKYKEYDEEKIKIDKEINKVQTAKMFYKKNIYNPIKGSFFDESKENDFQAKKLEREKTWGQENKKKMPNCAKGQSDLYNLISMQVVNDRDLKIADEKEHNKKKRYELRNNVENYYHDKNMKEMDKKESISETKSSYLRYKEIDDRKYDIIDLKEMPYKKHALNVKRDNLTDWEKIIINAGENNTFATRKIYKDTYDYSETGINYDRFNQKRQAKLNNLPKINQDTSFNGKITHPSKINKEDIKKEVTGNSEIDKKKWFEPPKNVFYDEQCVKKITKNSEMNHVRPS